MKLLFFLCIFFSIQIYARHEKVSYKEIPFKDYKISLRQENLKDGAVSALIEVRKGRTITAKKNYATIQSNGGHAAVHLNRRQKLDDIFMLYKFGDYDSRILLINAKGQLLDLPGGEIFHDEKEGRLIFLRNYETEPYAEYAVYDLKNQKIIFHLKDSAKVHTFNDQIHYQVMKGGSNYYAVSNHSKDKLGAVIFDMKGKRAVKAPYEAVMKVKLVPLKTL